MKRLLPVLLALLLLAGCSQETPPEPTVPSTEPVVQGLYDPDSAVEQNTSGAVHAFPLDRNDYFGLSTMGNRLLLRAEDGTMTVLQDEICVIAASVKTNMAAGGRDLLFDSSTQGAAYYLPESREVVLVNPQLQETDRVQLPEDIQGEPCICLDRSEIFYCVPGQIRAVNIQTGISRLIRSHSYENQKLHGVLFSNEVLLCELFGQNAAESTLAYISAETGKTFYDGDCRPDVLYTWGDSYVLHRMDGGVSQTLAGTREGEPVQLTLTETQYTSALPLGGILGYTAENDLTMRFYDSQSGICTSQVTLEGVGGNVVFLPTSDAIWILAYEGQQQMLYRWDVSKTPSGDETAYTTPFYTAKNPDTTGLEACYERAKTLGDTYGVRISLWEQLDGLTTDAFAYTAEYQVPALNQMLDEMEMAMAKLPKGFLKETLEAGHIYFYLVRSVSTEELTAHYWQEGDCHIVIANQGTTYEGFMQGVAYAIDAHVLGNSRKFDDWNELNPKGFAYSYSYDRREDADTYLSGEDSAFLTEKALAYPHDDRSSVFQAAMTEDNAQAFASAAMQAKLERMCRALRETYRWEKSAETYPWEQYLNISLAYQK